MYCKLQKIHCVCVCVCAPACVLDTVAHRAEAKRKLQLKSKVKIANWRVLLLLTALHLSKPKNPTLHNHRNL